MKVTSLRQLRTAVTARETYLPAVNQKRLLREGTILAGRKEEKVRKMRGKSRLPYFLHPLTKHSLRLRCDREDVQAGVIQFNYDAYRTRRDVFVKVPKCPASRVSPPPGPWFLVQVRLSHRRAPSQGRRQIPARKFTKRCLSLDPLALWQSLEPAFMNATTAARPRLLDYFSRRLRHALRYMAAKRATTPYKPTITSWVGCVVFGNHNKSSIEPTYAPLGARKVGKSLSYYKGE